MNIIKYILVAVVSAGTLAAAARGEVIRLQAKAVVAQRQDVRLADIATISGGNVQQNEELANMVIISGVEHPQKIKAESVLMAVMAQRGMSGMGSLQISGAAECAIDFTINSVPVAQGNAGAAVATTAPSAATSTVKASAKPVPTVAVSATPAPVAATAGGTLRQTILATLNKAIDLPDGESTISIDSSSPELDRTIAADQQWLCRPMTKTILGTVEVDAQLVQGTKVVEKTTIATQVERKQMVVVTTKRYGRGDIVTADGVRLVAVMLDRKYPTLYGSVAEVVGLEAQQNVNLGENADEHYFKPALMAHQGQMVTVVYVSGPLQAEISGRAMADAKRNERIQIRNDSGDTFTAVMIGRGIGVAGSSLTDAQEKKILEAFE